MSSQPSTFAQTDPCSLSVCLRQTMVALDMDGKVHKPQFELDSEQVRYEHRFVPFNSVVTPPPVHYIQFKVAYSFFCITSQFVLVLLKHTTLFYCVFYLT